MNNDAAALAHAIIEIEQIISEYLASLGKSGDANSAIEQVLLNIDTNDAIGIAQKILGRNTNDQK
jgi:hypothetical protein